jgi:hypothetical protein
MPPTTRSSTALLVDVAIQRVIDPSAARRLAQLLFAGPTGVVVATSTGVAS